MSTRSWICFSSSSGQTFRTLYSSLPQEGRSQLKAFFVDRECGALAVGQQELGLHRTHALPRKEFELLHLLNSRPTKVFTREEIFRHVWGNRSIVGDRTIDVHIRKIREKIGDNHIVTVKGVGYKFIA